MKPTIVQTTGQAARESEAADETALQLAPLIAQGQLRGGFVYAPVGYNIPRLRSELKRVLGDVPFIGATSCSGVGSSRGFHEQRGVVGLWLGGDGFRFGVAAGRKQGRASALGADLARAAAKSAGIAESAARFAVVHGTPGDEEQTLAGISSVLGPKTQIVGGSAADNDLTGAWQVWSSEATLTDGVALAVCDWPWRIAARYSGSQFPTKRTGRVTASRGRTLLRIDDRPAALVYNEWLNGALSDAVKSGGSILRETTLSPLGSPRKVGWTTMYLLIHPERIDPKDQSIRLFADVRDGDELTLMESTSAALVDHGARNAEFAMGANGIEASDVLGGLLVYCAGCLLSIGGQRADMLQRFQQTVAGAPYAAMFPYGEQGSLAKEAAHGNLMANVLLLTGKPLA